MKQLRHGLLGSAAYSPVAETRILPGENGRGFVAHTTQDVEPILERNKALQNEGDGYSPSRNLRRVASIPNVVIEHFLSQGIDILAAENREYLRRILNDPEWRWLRTAPGRV